MILFQRVDLLFHSVKPPADSRATLLHGSELLSAVVPISASAAISNCRIQALTVAIDSMLICRQDVLDKDMIKDMMTLSKMLFLLESYKNRLLVYVV
jgi:hypothetical protein